MHEKESKLEQTQQKCKKKKINYKRDIERERESEESIIQPFGLRWDDRWCAKVWKGKGEWVWGWGEGEGGVRKRHVWWERAVRRGVRCERRHEWFPPDYEWLNDDVSDWCCTTIPWIICEGNEKEWKEWKEGRKNGRNGRKERETRNRNRNFRNNPNLNGIGIKLYNGINQQMKLINVKCKTTTNETQTKPANFFTPVARKEVRGEKEAVSERWDVR